MTTAMLDTTTVRRWKRYPEYRPSGADWLPQVPAHWDVRKAQRIGRLLKGGGGNKADAVSEGVPCVRYGELYTTHGYSITACKTFVTPERAIDYTPIHYGDVLFAASGETLEEIGKSAVNLMRSSACCGGDLVILRPTIPTNAPFLGYAVDCERAVAQKASMGRGTTVKHIYPDELKHLVVALPPLAEQRAIAAFLDRETARIDALIGHKERLIALLEEKRQAVISHAVTRGLDPSAPLKDSGIPWLGMVPERWRMMRLKFLLSTPIEQGWSPVCDNRPAGEDEWAVLKVGCVNDHEFDPTEHKALPEGVAPDTRWLVHRGDVLMSRGNTRELVGSASLVNEVGSRVLLCDLLYRFRLAIDRADPEFVVRSLRSRYARYQIELRAEGASPSMRTISQDDIKELLLCLPPLPEQREITNALRSSMRQTDEMVARIRDGIARLQEYRTALISAAATGQIDVRGEVELTPEEEPR